MTDTKNHTYAIELKNVSKSFGSHLVLDDINLSVQVGKTTVITGASGEGKSVIIKHMMGLIHPDEGKVEVFGQDMTRIEKKGRQEVRKKFGVLFQNVALFDSMNIFDNVALPMRERSKNSESEIKKSVLEKLDLMGLKNIENKYPAQLSGGMQKRVGLARALILDPKIIFFDEPTTGLDAKRSNEIYHLFYRTQQELGYTAVIVSHDVPKIFKLSDYVALLADKKIQEVLSPAHFQRSKNPFIKNFVRSTMGHLYTSEIEEPIFYAPL